MFTLGGSAFTLGGSGPEKCTTISHLDKHSRSRVTGTHGPPNVLVQSPARGTRVLSAGRCTRPGLRSSQSPSTKSTGMNTRSNRRECHSAAACLGNNNHSRNNRAGRRPKTEILAECDHYQHEKKYSCSSHSSQNIHCHSTGSAAFLRFNLNYAQIRRSHRRWSWGGSGSRINSVI